MAPDELQPGDEIAGHRILGVAGRGGMGVVYRALQLDLERRVALKLIASPLARDEDFRSRFVREARAAAAIDHPNVIPVYGAGEDDGRLFLSMRLVEGDDLRERVRRQGPLAPAAAAALVAQVAGALDAAHKRGLVHRDVKPANVLLDGEHAYLTDFGLTKSMTGEASMTGAGHWVGTLGYVAPEQLRDQPVDARADVYALGCVLHFALTGVAPHRRESDEAALLAVLHDPPADPRAVVPDLPEALAAVVLRAQAKDPDDRPPSAGDLGRAALAAVGAGPAPPPERTVAQGRAAPGGGVPDAATAVAGTAPTVAAGAVAAPPRPSLVRRFAAPVLALLAGAATVGLLVALLGGDGGRAPSGATVATTATRTTPDAVATATVRVGARPNAIVLLGDRVWVAGGRTGRLVGLPTTGDGPRRSLDLPWSSGTSALAAGFGSLWALNGRDSVLARLDPATGALQATIALTPGNPVSVAAGAGSVWVGRRRGPDRSAALDSLIKVDPDTNAITAEVRFAREGISSVATGAGAVYVTNSLRDRVTRLDPRTGRRRSAAVGGQPRGLDVAGGSVWVANSTTSTVTQLTTGLNNPYTVVTGSGPSGVAVGTTAIWVANQLDSTVQRLDPRDGRLLGEPIQVGRNPFAIVADGDSAWVTSLADGTVTRLTAP